MNYFPALMKLRCCNNYCIVSCTHAYLKFVNTVIIEVLKKVTDRYTALIEDIRA